MDIPSADSPQPDRPATERARVRDLRVPPGGVLPKRIQTWLMVGIAFVIVLIILITGHTQAPAPPTANTRLGVPALAPADRIRNFEQQLAEEEARQQDAAARAVPAGRGSPVRSSAAMHDASGTTDEMRQREAQAPFADNVALSRRPPAQQPFAARQVGSATPATSASAAPSPELALLEQALLRVPPARTAASEATLPEPAPTATRPSEITGNLSRTSEVRQFPAPGERRRLLEGTVIEAALVNRLDGTFAGPVVGLVTTPVYTHDRTAVLIPAGARILGAAAPVQSWGDSRLAVSFHRLLMPDGHTYSLNLFKGLNQIGESGLRDQVNRHYLQVFGASLAIGALSGLAQYGTRSGAGAYDFGSEYRQALGTSLATSASRVLDRYLNVLPTITIREGARLKVYLTNDFELPIYGATDGGLR